MGEEEEEGDYDSGATMDWDTLRGMQLRAWKSKGVEAIPEVPSPPPPSASRRMLLTGELTAAMAAAAADMALSEAAAQEEQERAARVSASSGHGLLGFVRSERPPELELQQEHGVELARI